MPASPMDERGNVSILVLAGFAFLMVLLIGLTDLATYFIGRSRAQTAADAAVLATIAEMIPVIGEDPEAIAEEYASANGARLVSCECTMGETEAVVTVEVPLSLTFSKVRAVKAQAKAELTLPSSSIPEG